MIEVPCSKAYFFGPDHQLDRHQLLTSTIEAHEALDEFPAERLYRHLTESVVDGPSPFAVISNPDSQTSDNTAVVLRTPFANRLTPVGKVEDIARLYSEDPELRAQARESINKISWNMLTKHAFLQFALARAGLVDDEGKEIPIFIQSSPSGDCSPNFGATERKALAQGDFTPLAEETIDTVASKGFKNIYTIGYSLGGVLVPKLVETAQTRDINVKGAVIAEPAMRSGVFATAKAFMNFGPREYSTAAEAQTDEQKTGGWTDGSPLLIRRLSKTNGGWIGNIFADPRNNLATLRGLGKPEVFAAGLDRLIGQLMTGQLPHLAVAFSEFSRLSKGIGEHLANHPDFKEVFEDKRVLEVIVAGGHNSLDDQHGFGENHQYYVDMMSSGLLVR
jgi:hypothetical protein